MGNNASLIAVVSGTPFNSANYNSNMAALNNAAGYVFLSGSITQLHTFTGHGSGTFATGLASTGIPINGAFVYLNDVSMSAGGSDVASIFSLGDTTVQISTPSIDQWVCTVCKS